MHRILAKVGLPTLPHSPLTRDSSNQNENLQILHARVL